MSVARLLKPVVLVPCSTTPGRGGKGQGRPQSRAAVTEQSGGALELQVSGCFGAREETSSDLRTLCEVFSLPLESVDSKLSNLPISC